MTDKCLTLICFVRLSQPLNLSLFLIVVLPSSFFSSSLLCSNPHFPTFPLLSICFTPFSISPIIPFLSHTHSLSLLSLSLSIFFFLSLPFSLPLGRSLLQCVFSPPCSPLSPSGLFVVSVFQCTWSSSAACHSSHSPLVCVCCEMALRRWVWSSLC